MDIIVFKRIVDQMEKNKKVALVTVISASGISPAKAGLNMAVLEDRSTFGTIGGGNLEFEIIGETLEQLKREESKSYIYNKNDVRVEVFIKVFKSMEKLLIVGAGHVGYELYKIANLQKFYTVIFDSREELLNRERFPYADEIYNRNIEEELENYDIDNKCFIVACGSTHSQDEMVIRKCIDRGAKYLGMLGSRKKISSIKKNLRDEGISEESLDKIYAPIGINTGGDTINEIAFGIFGEVLAIKNNCRINHMKDIKK